MYAAAPGVAAPRAAFLFHAAGEGDGEAEDPDGVRYSDSRRSNQRGQKGTRPLP